jgi:uncharacterized protein YbbK (DUF523 family)
MRKNQKSSKNFIYLISACLAGVNCRWDGTNSRNQKIIELVGKGRALLVCPEELGGLSTPREKAYFFEGDGKDVIAGKGKVITLSSKDITSQLLAGAKKTLKMAKKYKIKYAIMKKNSPSCGCGKIYIKGKLVKGDGVATVILKRERIKIIAQ